jgi:hypothetical protein
MFGEGVVIDWRNNGKKNVSLRVRFDGSDRLGWFGSDHFQFVDVSDDGSTSEREVDSDAIPPNGADAR